MMVFLAFSIYSINHFANAQLTNTTYAKIIDDKFTVKNYHDEMTNSIIENYVPVEVAYESPTTIMLSGNLISTVSPESTMGTFNSGIWEAMDLMKNQYGFKVQQVMTSGLGNVGNPTTVYILMTK